MPELHRYEVDSSNVIADFTSGEHFVTQPDTSILGFLVVTFAHMLDPITLFSSIIVGVMAKSIKQSFVWGGVIGLFLAAVSFFMNQKIYQDYPLLDGWISQIFASLCLSSCFFGIKQGWQKLNRIQQEMDDEQAYLAEILNPDSAKIPIKVVHAEPVRGQLKINKTSKDINKPKDTNIRSGRSMNFIQRAVISVMVPIIVIIGLNSIATSVYYEPFNWKETWWVWMGGLGALTWFEVWFWRDQS